MNVTSSRRSLFALVFVVLFGAGTALAQQVPPDVSAPGTTTRRTDRTPAEAKLNSNLMYAVRAFAPTRGTVPTAVAPQVQAFIDANVAADQTIFVVIKGDVSADLVAMLKVTGAYDISEFPQYGQVTARVPITALVDIAQRSDVRSIAPNPPVRTNRWVPSPEDLADLGGAIGNAGTVNWQGVGAHKADLVQNSGFDGTGVKVCVLSDGVNSLALRIADGNLPAGTIALPGQAGNGDEGTAMMEIIHDIAPGATLEFATAFTSEPQFATNILSLQAAGCNIIVDDVTYFDEGAFQDGPVAQSVNTVTAAGVLYFSSAANSGHKLGTQSGTFEGDFVASGVAVPAAITTAEGAPVVAHAFGANPYTTLTATSTFIDLQWGSPLSGSDTTDYDLFVMDSTGTTIIGHSFNDQTAGGVQPWEGTACSTCPFPIGARIYIVKFAGSTRALRLDTNRGRIPDANATNGSTFGHNAAVSGITVASTGYNGGALLNSTPFTSAQVVDYYSSDGPRKMFFNPNGTQINASILFGTGGGTTFPKVDITASDCGSTATTGFTTFCGTSAAAPSAAAIAALIKSAKSTLTKAQVTTALKTSPIDIDVAGTDVNTGVGIVMADVAVRSVLTLTTAKSFVPPSIASGATSVLTIQVTNTNSLAMQAVSFTDTYPTHVVNAASPNAAVSGAGCVATLTAAGGGGTFGISAATIPAGVTCTYTVTVTSSTVGSYPDGSGTVTNPIAFNTALPSATLTVSGVVGAPPVVIGIVSRKVHGAAGTFDLPLTFTTPPTINHAPTSEARIGPTHQIVFTFDKPLTSGGVSITEGTATIAAGSGIAGSTAVINLSGVTDQQYVTVSLSGMASTDGGTGGVGTARIGFLTGDVNGSRIVAVTDLVVVNGQLGKPLTAANQLSDVNLSGIITVLDKVVVNTNLGHFLPAP